jgi:signal transduction histidine kinase
MTALHVVQLVVSLSFLALGLFTVVEWIQHRERSRGYLALALGTLGLTSILGQVNTLTGLVASGIISPLSLVLFMISGYSLLLFRDTFIPLARAIQVTAALGCAAVLGLYLLIGYPANPSATPTLAQSVTLIALILVWSACVLEPVVRFWLASRNRPSVQRARLRALAGGYTAIVFILLVAGFGGAAARSEAITWLFEILAIIAIPLLLVSFAPPRWLRRIWRQSEVDQLREAIHELVLFSPDRPTLAGRALDWAIRLVGAEGGSIVDADGRILASKGIAPDDAKALSAHHDGQRPQLIARPGSLREDAIVLPLSVDAGTGVLAVISGPFTPFFGTEEVVQLRAYTVNITAALDRARVTERLAALDRMKSQFLNLASHELRSPLGVINGYLSMLEQGALGQLKEPGMRAIEVLKAKTLEMNLLVSQMLDAARLEEGKLSLKRDHLDLRRIAEESADVVRPMLKTYHDLVIDESPTEVPVFGDPDRLQTIVTNLLENAIKYSPDGGRIDLRIWQDDGTARVSVADSGVGISSDDLSRLFNRFERLQNPKTRTVGGTGLGLYLSRELARQHGGDIEVRSEPERGSTFTLSLPLIRPLEGLVETTEQPLPTPVAVAPRLHVLSTEGEESRPA